MTIVSTSEKIGCLPFKKLKITAKKKLAPQRECGRDNYLIKKNTDNKANIKTRSAKMMI